ncbi:SDR family NAD(P)-dependent oxidoreductase [Candidatus Peregrinibacteria bacterium]|nr:SDR family NAD(P)-dependent oxidoreductase [Candidatus Peregrinibacteria bacterium]
MKYKNKIALVTGAASGIGHELAKKFVEKGSKVISLDLIDPEEKIEEVEYLKVDITDKKQVIDAIDKIDGQIDFVINNAGVMRRGHYDELTEEDFDLVMNVNVKGAWMVLKYAKAKMNKEAVVLQMSSKNARYFKERTAVYSISKAAIHVLSEIVQKSMPKYRVKTAFPGPVDTDLVWRGNMQKSEIEEKKKIVVSPEFMASKLIELIESPEPYLIYDKFNYKYYLSDSFST